MSLEFTHLECTVALTILRTARDELRERQLLLGERMNAIGKVALAEDPEHLEEATLALENRLYIIQAIVSKLWCETHRLSKPPRES